MFQIRLPPSLHSLLKFQTGGTLIFLQFCFIFFPSQETKESVNIVVDGNLFSRQSRVASADATEDELMQTCGVVGQTETVS